MDLDVHQEFGRIGNWINGQHAVASSASYEHVYSPYTGNVIAEVPFSNRGDLDAAVSAARAAYPAWSNTNIKDRAQVMFKLKALLEQNLQELGDITALESGKLPAEARAGIMKGIEVIEFACSMPNLVAGRTLEVSQGVECRSIAEPLGVIASIVPFNFPSMVPLWTLPIALTAGNCMILKSSEQVPLSALKIAEHLQEAGLPDGVFNVVNGGREIVEGICDHDDIKAVSFVGSSKVAQLVYSRCAEHGKRVLALGGAKNHTILMPDADPESSPKGIVDSAMGCAGQRCMAVSVLVAVGQTQDLIGKMVSYANSLKLGEHMGAIINKASLERINRYIDEAESMGAEVIVDGRGKTVDGLEDGYWIGPTIIDNVSADMPCACDEIFG
ncbi:MAG: aldehyde dehydrogenase family protein, partial [Pirellulaceae bacterium]|nr:aldehyde dehydrogenase family protein [Pirellulaceae bacterium]